MKKIILLTCFIAMIVSCQKQKSNAEADKKVSVVYVTQEITPESLVKIYEALGVKADGNVAVKISTGEGSNPNYLKPELIKDLVLGVNGTIVECNTAYGSGPGNEKDERNTSENHWKVIEQHGFTKYFKVDIMDEEGEIKIPVQDESHIKYDIVGKNMENYDFMIALNHFKGHPMGGYGGALKNLSIGCASKNGKAYIHSAGKMEELDMEKLWTPEYIGDQDGFLESMAAAAQAVTDYFTKKKGIIYISVMNNMSIDCDCVDHPAPVKLEDYGILASLDPVALDQACVDIINSQQVTATNDPTDLLNRIDKQHGVHTIEYAAQLGLGSREYILQSIDGKDMLAKLNENGYSLVVRSHGKETTYTQKGVRDLLDLKSTTILHGAAVADKVIGTAAAFLMIEGGVRFVATNVISKDALRLLTQYEIVVEYDEVVDVIMDSKNHGECPLEKMLKGEDDVKQAVVSIERFLQEQK
ncbi:MAG: DUF1893 domain-containing protein [Paludibacteraceae bacterium]|nr:DUF1893 domain-containing protein [Paludibacteraceae bacterium]